MLWMALGCGLGLGGGPSELWLRLEDPEEDGNRVSLTLPATVLREDGPPAELETASGPVDLRPIARRLRAGAEERWELPDGGVAVLSAERPDGGHATEVAMGITGPKGRGVTVNVPLQPEDLADVRRKASLDVDVGLPVDLDRAACDQLRRSGPRPILEVVGPKGNGLRVSTR